MSRPPSLRARLQPLADKFTDDLPRLIEQRVERDLERVSASLDIALSAFASEMADLSDEVQVPIDSGHVRVSMPSPIAEPQVAIPPPRAMPVAADGKKPITCRSCGYVGGNARGCGTAHITQPLAKPVARDKFGNAAAAWEPIAVTPPRVRATPPKIEKPAPSTRASVIAQRAGKLAPRAATPEENDDNYNADERWSPERRHNATVIAEGGKRSGELPRPRSSFRVERDEVEELNFEVDG